MKTAKDKEKILNNYKQQGENILLQMIEVLSKAQKKTDNAFYGKILEKLKKI